MKMLGAKAPTIDEFLSGHEFGGNAEFRASLSQMMNANPHRRPSDLLFIATAIYRTTMAALETARASIVAEERARIMEIVNRATQHDLSAARIGAAILLAVQTDFSPDDAIAILDAQQTADAIRPN